MGQYYRGAILTKSSQKAGKDRNGSVRVVKAFCPYAHDNNGAKLMEHSYVGNCYVKAYERALAEDYFGQPFVWVGDYADSFINKGKEEDLYVKACRHIEKIELANAKSEGFKRNPEKGWNFGKEYRKKGDLIYEYKSSKEFSESITYEQSLEIKYKYILNLTKKTYIVIPESNGSMDYPTIHPLPLLCADGNGRGGGDYNGSNMCLIGAWAYDCIGVANELPEDFKTELVVTFVENHYNPENKTFSPDYKDYKIVQHD